MTTIAYKDGIIAYDSRMTQGPTIVDDDHEKMAEREGHCFFACGCLADIDMLIDLFFGKTFDLDRDYNVAAFIVTPEGELWQASIDMEDKTFWKHKRRLDNCWAMGSGADHALTAMDMGADAVTAVRMAIRRDTGSGGKIRRFIIGQGFA